MIIPKPAPARKEIVTQNPRSCCQVGHSASHKMRFFYTYLKILDKKVIYAILNEDADVHIK